MVRCIIILLCSASLCFSQTSKEFPLIEEFPVWNIEVIDRYVCLGEGCYPGNSLVTYSYSYDTVFCGEKYFKVNYYVINPNGLFFSNENLHFPTYIRKDSSKIFVRTNSDCNSPDYLMYDFSAEAGDTLICGYINYWGIPHIEKGLIETEFIVADVDTVFINNIPLRRLKIVVDSYVYPNGTYSNSRDLFWIEGIGSNWNPFYSTFNFEELETVTNCLTDSSATKFVIRENIPDCNYIIPFGPGTNTNDREKSVHINIFPNPFSESLIIENLSDKALELTILDITGRKVFSQKSNTQHTINLKLPLSMNCGMYFFNVSDISSGENILLQKIIKL